MANLIQVTELENGKERAVWINTDQIIGMLPIAGGATISLTVHLPNHLNNLVTVKESPEEIGNRTLEARSNKILG